MAIVSKTAEVLAKQKSAVSLPAPDYNLVEEDGEPLDSDWHRAAINLLIEVVRCWFRQRTDYYAGGNMFIYFSPRRAQQRRFRGPDFFFVDGVPFQPPRRYWVVWQEGGRFPDVIMELLSPKTARTDRTTKKRLYERTFRTHEYCIFDPDKQRLEGWRLDLRARYRAIKPDRRGWLWIEKLQLWLGLWHGTYQNISAAWPRFFDLQGRLVPTRAEEERQRADEIQAELEQLKARLAKLEDRAGF